MSDSLKKTSALLICSFLVSDLSDLLKSLILMSDLRYSLTSLSKKEGMSESLGFFFLQKTYQKYHFSQKKICELLVFCEQKSE